MTATPTPTSGSETPPPRVLMDEIVETSCPYCGEQVDVRIAADGGSPQRYVEDCPVCCNPWEIIASETTPGSWNAELKTIDE